MALTKEFFLKLFDAAYMQRWNDKLRPIQFIEFDKQAHKLMIIYLLGKYEERIQPINWIELIEGALFEFLQRLIITDIKPTILDKIKRDYGKAKELNEWTFTQVEPLLAPLGEAFTQRYKEYFAMPETSITRRIIGAAHAYASQWEYKIIERYNPDGYDNDFISRWFESRMEHYYDLEGIKQLTLYRAYRSFIDLCGQLRYQIRWANILRFPKTSVLGHSLFVAFTSYLFTMLQGGSPKRCYNNTFTGLFHDLPEVLTRDIITPVKNSIDGLSDIIRQCEAEQMKEIVYPLLPDFMQDEIRFFTEMEFSDCAFVNGNAVATSTEEINQRYNEDRYTPRDGKLIKGADELSAYLEAYLAIINGSKMKEFQDAYHKIQDKYVAMGQIGTINIGALFMAFTLPEG